MRSLALRLPRHFQLAVVASGLVACLGDPAGPGGVVRIQPVGLPDSIVGAPGRALAGGVTLRVTDGAGQPIAGARIRWTVAGLNGRVEDETQLTGPDGLAVATWILGTRASDTQHVAVEARTTRSVGSIDLLARAQPVEVSALRFVLDTSVVKLGVAHQLEVEAVDPFGNTFVPATVAFTSLDTGIVTVDSSGSLTPRRRGAGRVAAASGGFADTSWVSVVQQVQTILIDLDSVTFSALGDTFVVPVVLVDDRGLPVLDSLPDASVEDTAVVQVLAGTPIRVSSRSNGSTTLMLSAAGVTRAVALTVAQEAHSIDVSTGWTTPILSLALNATIPLTCRVLDRNGYETSIMPSVAPSAGGRWTGASCADLRLQASGFDTLRFTAGAIATDVPLILAVRPVVTPSQGEPLQVDSLPSGTGPWAPTLRLTSTGTMELYFAAYDVAAAESGSPRGDLHRLVSQDGITFRYDDVVLRRDSVECDLNGSAIENVDIVPRAEGGGWRMFYASGSFPCYGWQVFSAISSDERTWIKEPGIRLSNGGASPPAPPVTPPWPAGEGMVTDQLQSGEWRMIVSTYEHLQPTEDKFQITEWRSADQLVWTYTGPVLTTRDLPPEGQRSAYSPTIREFGPGLWRMVFTADDLNVVGGRSRLWSAVSADRQSWQVEGEMLSAPGFSYYYATLVGERLVTILGNRTDTRRLYTASLRMP